MIIHVMLALLSYSVRHIVGLAVVFTITPATRLDIYTMIDVSC